MGYGDAVPEQVMASPDVPTPDDEGRLDRWTLAARLLGKQIERVRARRTKERPDHPAPVPVSLRPARARPAAPRLPKGLGEGLREGSAPWEYAA